MAKHKQSRYVRTNKNGIDNKIITVPEGSCGNRKKFDILLRTPVFVIEWVLIWAFLYFFYGDVLLVAEQRSFFAFDSTVMQSYLSQSLGWLYVSGRFLLLSGVSPALASFLLSTMLVVSAWLIDGAFRIKGWWHVVSVSLPFLYFIYLFYMGLNLVYLRESSWLMTIPLGFVVCSTVVAILSKLFFKTDFSFRSFFRPFETVTPRCLYTVFGLIILLTVSCVSVALTYAQNDRITCAMERYMYDEEWDKMADVAQKASQPSRTVMGLYAIALNQNGRMATELFNIPMQYGNIHLSTKNGTFDSGIDYLVVYGNFYAGLTRAAYHEAVEQTVLEGPSVARLKYMVKCALIDHENALAEKYLAILKKVPFETEFVSKYSEMLLDYDKVAQDNELASVIELQPVKDSFEQAYRKPMFLGYNVKLLEAKSIRGLNNCLYACLYSKDLKSFGQRIVTMIQNGVMLPKVFEEAIIVENIKNLSVLKQLNLSPYTLQEMKNFMGDCFTSGEKPMKEMSEEEKHELSKKKARKFKDKYLGTYEYYYYFQNVPDENYVIKDTDEKSGVN